MADKMQRSTPDFDQEELEMLGLLEKPQPPCPPLDLLSAYSEDVLPLEQKEAIKNHISNCRLCSLLLADLKTLPEASLSNAQFERIRATIPNVSGHRTASSARLYSFFGVAAALLLAALLSLATRLHYRPLPSVASVAPSPEGIAHLEIPISPLPPPEGMLLTRGFRSDGNPSVDLLMPAFAAYNRGDYAIAADNFISLRSQYPKSELVALYLGISQLYLHQDADAYAALTSIPQAQPRSANAMQWYAAVAAERMHSATAPKQFAEICASQSSPWSAQSCQIASQLKITDERAH